MAAEAGVAAAMAPLSACSECMRLPEGSEIGPAPRLVQPVKSRQPRVKIVPALPWPEGSTPLAAASTQAAPFATALHHPRWLDVLPKGDVLVVETNAPARPDRTKAPKGLALRIVMARAGAGVPSANRITLLRVADGDGRIELRTVLLSGLNHLSAWRW